MHDKKVQVIVCQRGARRRYAVPRILEEAGLLKALYTDSSAFSLLGRAASILEKIGINNKGIQSLVARKPRGIPRKKIFSSDLLAIYTALKIYGKDPLLYDDVLSKNFKKWGAKNVDYVYNMNTADIPFLKFAKSKGLKIVVDVFVSPLTEQIMEIETQFYNTGQSNQIRNKKILERYKTVFKIADILLCPSNWVAEGCMQITPEYQHKIRICPYGSSIEITKKPKTKVSNKVLFAGRDVMRKGLHYLADAGVQLKQKGLNVEIFVAGVEKETCSWIKNVESLNFLGHVPMQQMRQQFEKAAVFVLPSLSEGQAGVVVEALAMGCPVIITRECGVDIEDGKQGFIVPARDSNAIASKVEEILSNQSLWMEMSQNAIEFASRFSLEAWSDRMVKIFD